MKKNTLDQHYGKYLWHFTVAEYPYDTRLLDSHGLVSYRPFTVMLVWSVFSILPKCLFVIVIMYAYFWIFHKVV